MNFFYRWLLWLGVASFTWGAEAYDDGESKGADDQSTVPRSEKSVDEAKNQAAFSIALRGTAEDIERRREGGESDQHNFRDATTRGIRDDEGFIGEVAAPQVEKGITPLMEAIIGFREDDDPASILEELQKAKEDGAVNQQSQPSGRTALMDLVERVQEDVLVGAPGGGDPGLLQHFLDAGADPNIEDIQQQNTFLISVRERKYTIANYLLPFPQAKFQAQLNGAMDLILSEDNPLVLPKSFLEVANTIINKVNQDVFLSRTVDWLQLAVKLNNKALIEKIILRFLDASSVSRSTDDSLYMAPARRFQPLYDMGLAIADKSENRELQSYFLEKGALRDTPEYSKTMLRENRVNLPSGRTAGEEFRKKTSHREVAWPTLMMTAAQEGDLDGLIEAHKTHPGSIRLKTAERGDTALHFAVRNNHIYCAEALTSWGASMFILNDESVCPFEEAFELKHLELLECLFHTLTRVPFQLMPRFEKKIREIISTEEDIKILKKIKKILSADGSLIGEALSVNEHLEMRINSLLRGKSIFSSDFKKEGSLREYTALDEKTNVNKVGRYGWTPLLQAIQKGSSKVCEVLLKNGADANEPVLNGATPLSAASELGQHVICKQLLDYGADVNMVIYTKKAPPLFYAAGNGHYHVCELLLERGADLNQAGQEAALPPLMSAAYGGHSDVCHLLLQKGAKVNQVNKHNVSSLMSATLTGHPEVCRVLLSYGADVNVKAIDNSTALTAAAQFGFVKIVRLLLPYVDNLNHADDDGDTAMSVAKQEAQNEQLSSDDRDKYEAIVAAIKEEEKLRETQGIVGARLSNTGKKEEESDEVSSVIVAPLEDEVHHYGAGAGSMR